MTHTTLDTSPFTIDLTPSEYEVRLGATTVRLNQPGPWVKPEGVFAARKAYAAAHVVPLTTGTNTPGAPAEIDWESTLAFRAEMFSYGLGVAEAMDTAQRGMGLDWPACQQLIAHSAEAARAFVTPERSLRDLIACGAGTDQLDPATVQPGDLETVLNAYREQIAVVEASGAKVILMASRALVRAARTPEDYVHVYTTLLDEVAEPAVLHWLGDVFDPALAGYWGSADVPSATDTFVTVLHARAAKIDGVKVSLLDAEHEKGLRRQLPAGVRLYTGDDFNYPELIAGDGEYHSDALLGIFAAIAPAAATALAAYDAGDDARARAILDLTRPLGLHIFEAPTYYYKTGIAFLAWLNGYQPGFQMVGGLHSGRSVAHLVRLVQLASDAGLLLDPALAKARLEAFAQVNGL
ncbi:dihydrodipicolinate synthase family protein [Micrococcales bacterium 31B]|nr:dihydrodipicolinate synthase family protein [Micrococcales bacterium 31B]